MAACVNEASPHEVTLVQKTLDARLVDALPRRLIGDRAYDTQGCSDPLDAELAAQGVEMTPPHRKTASRRRRRTGGPYAASDVSGRWGA